MPKYIADTQSLTCFAFKVIVTADCSPGLNAAERQPTTAGTSAGNYNPLYYLVVGLPSRILSGEPAIYAMRILSGLLCSLFLAATLFATTQFANRRWPVVAAGIAVTPMVLYLCGAINPNALEIVTTSAVFVNLCLVLENVRDLSRFRFNIIVVGVSAAVLANTRALSLLWLALAVVAALLMVPPRDLLLLLKNKLVLAMTALIAVAAACGLLWLKTSNTLASLLGTPSTATPEQAFGTMLERTFDIAASYVAQLGWLDTNGPTGVYFWWSCLTGALMVAAVSVKQWRPRLGFIVLFAAAIAIPPILQAQVVSELGLHLARQVPSARDCPDAAGRGTGPAHPPVSGLALRQENRDVGDRAHRGRAHRGVRQRPAQVRRRNLHRSQLGGHVRGNQVGAAAGLAPVDCCLSGSDRAGGSPAVPPIVPRPAPARGALES